MRTVGDDPINFRLPTFRRLHGENSLSLLRGYHPVLANPSPIWMKSELFSDEKNDLGTVGVSILQPEIAA